MRLGFSARECLAQARVWGPGVYADPRTLDGRIRSPRRKLEAGAGQPARLLAGRGVGFRCVA